MAVRVSSEAEAELDDIWHYTAVESSNIEIAQRLLDAIRDQFALLSKSPFLGRRRDDLKVGLRSITRVRHHLPRRKRRCSDSSRSARTT
jgi:plasmid stabilization system protein ParE